MKNTESIPAMSTTRAIETRMTSSSSYTRPQIRLPEEELIAFAVEMREKSKNIPKYDKGLNRGNYIENTKKVK
jgi:hypothetical protein